MQCRCEQPATIPSRVRTVALQYINTNSTLPLRYYRFKFPLLLLLFQSVRET